jgi:hypothetical protein
MHFFNFWHEGAPESIAKMMLMIESGKRLYDDNKEGIDAFLTYNTHNCVVEIDVSDATIIVICDESNYNELIIKFGNIIMPIIEKMQPEQKCMDMDVSDVSYRTKAITFCYPSFDTLNTGFVVRRIIQTHDSTHNSAAFVWNITAQYAFKQLCNTLDIVREKTTMVVNMDKHFSDPYKYVDMKHDASIFMAAGIIKSSKPIYIRQINGIAFPCTTLYDLDISRESSVQIIEEKELPCPDFVKPIGGMISMLTESYQVCNDGSCTCQNCGTMLITRYACGLFMDDDTAIGICLVCAYDVIVEILKDTKYPIKYVNTGVDLRRMITDHIGITMKKYNSIIDICKSVSHYTNMILQSNAIVLKHGAEYTSKDISAMVSFAKQIDTAKVPVVIIRRFF